MALPGFRTHPKFRRLLAMLRIPEAHALGHLHMLWEVGYNSADPLIGDSIDVEAAAGWIGDPGVLCDAFLRCGGDRAGFIEEDPERPGRFQIHDLFDHAPQYVTRRAQKNAAREASGMTISDLRREAGLKGAEERWAKSKPTDSKRLDVCHESLANDSREMANCHLPFPSLPLPSQKREEAIASCAEPDPPTPAPDASPVLYLVPCKGLGGKGWGLTQAKIDEWTEAFPGVDVKTHLRKAIQWLKDNPSRGKTARGMPAFFGNWLSREQDRNSKTQTNTNGAPNGKIHHRTETDQAYVRQLEDRDARRSANSTPAATPDFDLQSLFADSPGR